MPRLELIARKHEVIAQIQRARRELEREDWQDTRRHRRRRDALQRSLEALMAEEYRLRLAIDRSK